jgi:putative ABC transport system permease protein
MTNPNLMTLLNQSVSTGTFLSYQQNYDNSVILGSNAANALFSENIPLGRTLMINGQSFTVMGIMNAFPNTPLSQNEEYNNAVFIPYSVEESLTNNTAATFEILAQTKNPKNTKSVITSIRSALVTAHGGQSDFSVLTANQSLVTSSGVLTLLTQLITGVAAISLLVGGVGIMNVMLVSVTERMHEIGIRKAIGATNRQILSQFMIESTMLSLSGGIIGVILALVVDVGLRLATSLQPIISWQTVILATGISFIIGVVFGSVPALKAARKDPISALRIE